MKVLVIIASLLCVATAGLLTGGWSTYTAKLTDPEVAFAFNSINDFFHKDGKDGLARSAVSIVSSKSQVVAGVKYALTLEASSGQNIQNDICDVTLWVRAWLAPPENYIVTDIRCSKKNTPAAPAEPDYKIMTANMDDFDVQEALKVLVDRLNMQCNCLYRRIPVVGSGFATKEVNNGLHYRFADLKLVDTTCSNNSDKDQGKITFEECPKNTNSATTTEVCGGEAKFNPLAGGDQRYTVVQASCSVN